MSTSFPRTGFVRLSQILAPAGPIPVSKSTWWQGVKDGRFPQPQKLGPRTTVWKVEDILALFQAAEMRSVKRSDLETLEARKTSKAT